MDNAVAVAKRLGEEDGWENSPWEALLAEMLSPRRDEPYSSD